MDDDHQGCHNDHFDHYCYHCYSHIAYSPSYFDQHLHRLVLSAKRGHCNSDAQSAAATPAT